MPQSLTTRPLADLPTLAEVAESIAKNFNTDPVASHSIHSNRFANRFGEVLACWAKCKSLQEVADHTGLTTYVIRKYFLSDEKFRVALEQANTAIFMEATQSIRDNQASFVEKAQRLAQQALDEMEALLNDSESEHLRFKVAQDLLDRDPLQRASRATKVHSTAINVNIEAKAIALALEAAAEVEKSSSIVDLPSNEVNQG